MDEKLSLKPTGREDSSFDHKILDRLDRLMDSANEQNMVLYRMMSALNLPELKETFENETSKSMQLGASILELKKRMGAQEPSWLMQKQRAREEQINKIENDYTSLEELIRHETNEQVLDLINRHIDILSNTTHVTSTTTVFNIIKLPETRINNIVNLHRINDIRRINKFFESVNSRLPMGGTFISCVETYSNRKARILKKSFSPLNWIHYTFDVFIKRIIPKLPVLKKIYFSITRGRNRVLSKAETFGRLYSCGFELIETREVGDIQYIVCKKVNQPQYPENPTYGPIVRLRRHGKDGILFDVFKLRTMHAYSEYLQDYVYEQNKLQEGGKFANDFRITTEGKFFRKFWLDELPMFINLLKGQMKLVGVRPLSKQYFNLYSEELKEKRTRFKPGLIPPFYADLPETLDEIMASELRYLELYEKNPIRTDLRYLGKALHNILLKKARSN